MILNELSMENTEGTEDKFNEIMSNFLKVCHKISTEKNDHDFYCTQELFLVEFVPGYTIHHWLGSDKVPKREKDLFRKMTYKKQLLDKSHFWDSEFVVDRGNGRQESSVGCLAAYEAEGTVVSMQTDLLWEQEEIKGIYISAEEDDKEAFVGNCCFIEHVDHLERVEKEKAFRMVSSGAELWDKRESIFPHLVFCDCVQKQLAEARNSLHIKMIMKRLQILENYFQDFDGKFDKHKVGYGCREESETVKKNDKLRGMRVFKLPDKSEEFFSWHISFSGDFPGRIHFIPDTRELVGIIGYVGKHLPTKDHTTI